MLKKVAIAAAAATVGLLALTPLAFAGDKDDIVGKQVCSNEVTSNPPDPFALLTGPLNGNIGSCRTFSFVFPPE